MFYHMLYKTIGDTDKPRFESVDVIYNVLKLHNSYG